MGRFTLPFSKWKQLIEQKGRNTRHHCFPLGLDRCRKVCAGSVLGSLEDRTRVDRIWQLARTFCDDFAGFDFGVEKQFGTAVASPGDDRLDLVFFASVFQFA